MALRATHHKTAMCVLPTLFRVVVVLFVSGRVGSNSRLGSYLNFLMMVVSGRSLNRRVEYNLHQRVPTTHTFGM